MLVRIQNCSLLVCFHFSITTGGEYIFLCGLVFFISLSFGKFLPIFDHPDLIIRKYNATLMGLNIIRLETTNLCEQCESV